MLAAVWPVARFLLVDPSELVLGGGIGAARFWIAARTVDVEEDELEDSRTEASPSTPLPVAGSTAS